MTLLELFKTKTDEEILNTIQKYWYLEMHMSHPLDIYGDIYDLSLCEGCKHHYSYIAGPRTVHECALSYPHNEGETCPHFQEQKEAKLKSIKEFLNFSVEVD